MSAEDERHDPLAATLELDALDPATDPEATLLPTMAPRFRKERLAALRARRAETMNVAGESTVRLKQKLADGGMGRVFLAEQVALGREVAVKTLRDEFLEAEFAERLVREARVTGLVEHPHIVPVYTLRTDERGVPQMVMRRIDGVSFRAVLKNPSHPLLEADGTEPLEWAIRVLSDVCDALAFAHSRGIVHLDVKPDNIMVGEFRDVYLVDWGVAASLREEHRGLLPMVDETTEVLGTPAYLAPEILDRSLGSAGIATDVFLLGATLYEILAKRPPYRGGTVRDILNEALLARPPELPEDAPKELVAIARRAMSPKPADRYATASDFRAALARYARHRGSNKLADQGHAFLAILRDEAQAGTTSDERVERLTRRFAECRFLFAQALREWPENAFAHDGMTEVTLLLAELHVAREEHAAARSVLAELTDPSPRFVPRVDALSEDVEAHLKDAQEARVQRNEMDDSASRVARARFVFVIVGIVVLPMFLGVALERLGLYTWVGWHSLAYGVLVLVAGVSGALAMRRTLMPNRIGRRYIVAFGLLTVGIFGRRGLALLMGYDTFEDIAMDLYLFGAASSVIAVFMDRRFFVVAFASIAAAFAIAFFPEHALLLVAIAGLVGPSTIAVLWLLGARDEPPRRERGARRISTRPPAP